jgi:predicted ester cyclase
MDPETLPATSRTRVQSALVLFDCLNRHDLSGVETLFGPEFEGYRAGNRILNADQCRSRWRAVVDAAPDLRCDVLQVFDNDPVVTVQWRCTGTHRAPLREVLGDQPIPATQRAFVVDGVLIQEIVSGRIRRAWGYFDRLALMEQLGLLQAPARRH